MHGHLLLEQSWPVQWRYMQKSLPVRIRKQSGLLQQDAKLNQIFADMQSTYCEDWSTTAVMSSE